MIEWLKWERKNLITLFLFNKAEILIKFTIKIQIFISNTNFQKEAIDEFPKESKSKSKFIPYPISNFPSSKLPNRKDLIN